MDHTVTYENTRKHWTLYTLDAWEEANAPEGREGGAKFRDVYEFAGGDDTIIYNGDQEVASLLSELARETESLQRKAEASTWSGPDVRFNYRLSEYGRQVLIDLGTPSQLPNRQDMEEDDRALPVRPAHEPGWWRDDWELADKRFDDPDDWVETDHSRVFYRSDADEFNRGEFGIAKELADAFPECTFVITMGPWRMHDIAYAIRDPFDRIIQLDVYSAGMVWGDRDWERNVASLSEDLHKGLETTEAQ